MARLTIPIVIVGIVLAGAAVALFGNGSEVLVQPTTEVASARQVAEPVASSVEPPTSEPLAAVPQTSTTTTVPLPPPPPRTAQLAFTGDTLAHRGVVQQAATNAVGTDQAYDFAPMFDEVQEVLSAADVAICHLETPLSPGNDDLSGFPTFNVPREMADGLFAAGYDGCTFASNHSLDRRPDGVGDTLGVLDEAGLLHSGGARDQAEFDAPTIYDANGIAVASLSYSYGFNGFREPVETPWLVNEIDIAEISAEVQRSIDAGAEYVALSLHWGTEYVVTPDEFQVSTAEAVAAIPGIDIVIGHHAHVVQPTAFVGDTPVVYGLGNFLSNQSANCCAAGSQDGLIMQVNIEERNPGSGDGFQTSLSYVPTWVDRSDFTIVPVAEVLDDSESTLGSTEREVLVASRQRTRDSLDALGNQLDVVEAG